MTTGTWFGVAAYTVWGLMPLYWPLAKPATALEILAHRVLWSFVLAAILIMIGRARGWIPPDWAAPLRSPRTLTLLVLAGALIGLNWGVYIWAVNSDHVVEAALGYYINPILSILAGVLLLRERLRVLQWIAVGLAGVAVVILTIGYGRPPWISLILACSFAGYGLIKNRLKVAAVTSLAIESLTLSAPAAVYLIWLASQHTLTFGHGLGASLALVGAGPVTVVPLLFFAGAATRIPLSLVGLLQYITPTLQFLLGVLWFAEAMPPSRWVGFCLVWVALLLLAGYAARALIRQRRRRAHDDATARPTRARRGSN